MPCRAEALCLRDARVVYYAAVAFRRDFRSAADMLRAATMRR